MLPRPRSLSNLERSRDFAQSAPSDGPKYIIDMMYRRCNTNRWLVATCLMVSLGLSGLFPQMMVWTESPAATVAEGESTTCCCGTETGYC